MTSHQCQLLSKNIGITHYKLTSIVKRNLLEFPDRTRLQKKVVMLVRALPCNRGDLIRVRAAGNTPSGI